MAVDVYETITNTVIKHLEEGVPSWSKSWNSTMSVPLRWNGEEYHGINVIVLLLQGMANGFTSPYWMTFKQANELGGHIKKGSKSSMVTYSSVIVKEETDDDGNEVESKKFFLRYYNVFNADQIEGLPEEYYHSCETDTNKNKNENLDKFFEKTGAKIKYGYHSAMYNSVTDTIHMPNSADFVSEETFYSTLAHETVHWSGHHTRLNRSSLQSKFGSDVYAFEELIAELGCLFISMKLGIQVHTREDHSSYIASWLKALKNDKRMIFKAATKAKKAAEYIFEVTDEMEMAA